MDFAIRKDARDWFKDIRPDFAALPGTASAPDFDAFYFCFIAGIAAIRKKDVLAAETATLVENFPGPYRNRGNLLIAMFLSRELDYLGVEITEKKAVHAAISRLVDPGAPNHLSDDGVREFNKYAHGGYDVLLDWFDDRPRSLETFLRAFKVKLDGALSLGKAA
ncbi:MULTISPECIES: hypothetical protein [Rhodomicrobium]|uniref:hypothetical protein n=1 Tax=Rhodomicrobium TaxID=1068 RepID=UPI001FD99F6B|nr:MULTISPECIES: hypothetical protein [Rhodomicrobium]